jgi:hypothetical protein
MKEPDMIKKYCERCGLEISISRKYNYKTCPVCENPLVKLKQVKGGSDEEDKNIGN